MAENPKLPTTQRAYTLRLTGADPSDNSWRDPLWATHEAVNNGAKAFGDWLLTTRGGLPHTLADADDGERSSRRSLLALSWLSVESAEGAPKDFIVEHDLDKKNGERSNWQTVPVLESLLKKRAVPDDEIASWANDCRPSLLAAIRPDAVWVNRSRIFDDTVGASDPNEARDYAVSVMTEFFGDTSKYLAPAQTTDEDPGPRSPQNNTPKEFRELARGWLSTNWGTGVKSNQGYVAEQLRKLSHAVDYTWVGRPGRDVIEYLRQALGGPSDVTDDPIDGIRRLVGWKGRSSKGRVVLEATLAKPSVTEDDLMRLSKKLAEEADQKSSRRQLVLPGWMSAVRANTEREVGFPFVGTRDMIGEFAVMLDHAARRVSAARSWAKLAEARRRECDSDAQKINAVPGPVKVWLDRFCESRSLTSGALEAYRIRKRAVVGWKEIVKAWSRVDCASEEDRIAAARALQEELEKFGDIQLFEALATDEARHVWQPDGIADPQPLIDYVAAKNANANMIRFKVPSYRHPDILRHPVFCEFGKSRWVISFAVHEAVDNPRSRAPQVSPHSVEMKLWTGHSLEDTSLHWMSKRFAKDLGLRDGGTTDRGTTGSVTRNDRLGRAAAGLDASAAADILGLFQEKDWNGRLQAPRAQFCELAEHVGHKGWDSKAQAMRSNIRWLISFSARLRPHGPWVEFAARNGLWSAGNRAMPLAARNDRDSWRGIAYPFWHPSNEAGRVGMAKHLLSRLPALRILAVDLGHRYAAACAVWETLSMRQTVEACHAAGHRDPMAADLCLHLATNGRTAICRRVGEDRIVDAKSGEVKEHPAPWARLDRQFLIKLQGENEAARKASPDEIATVEQLEHELGRVASDKRSKRVDELMSDAVGTVRLAIKRHGRRARIAYNLTASKKLMSGAREEGMSAEGLVDLLTNTIIDWYNLATDARWTDARARQLWQMEIERLPGGFLLPELADLVEDVEAPTRKKLEKELETKVKPLAVELAKRDRMKLHTLWATRWKQEDSIWTGRLRWLRDWILPRKSKATGAIRHVGGLSLQRIATIKSLYQVQKAFFMRPDPDDLRKNIPKRGDDSLTGFGRSVLETMERMRENRVKQLASRIVEAALGIGVEQPMNNKKDPKRPRERIHGARFAPCHAVVIENLTNYRPEETRTRRENRQLMSWSSGKVRDYLTEACQLNGLHLREVRAAYTSRQDSRTGAPGVRCVDVPVTEFLESPFWKREVGRAEKKGHGKEDERDRYIVELRDLAEETRKVDPTSLPKTFRIPTKGGDIFVSADRSSPAANGLQADLNAAANIGLKSLLDPDWPGRWWYVPCITATGEPDPESTKGSLAVDGNPVLLPTTNNDTDSAKSTSRKMRQKKGSDRTNAWRHVSPHPLSEGKWYVYAAYQNIVLKDVVNVLRSKLRKKSWAPPVSPTDQPGADFS